MGKHEKITDDELRVICEREIKNAFGYRTGKLSEARRKALQYFLARPVGDLAPPDIEGRSSVVSTDVADTIRGLLPRLMKTFHGGDSVVEFEPTTPDDEQNAKQATDYINYIYNRKNDGFSISRTWMMDAMLSKVGIVKVWWEEKEEQAREQYHGLNDIELAKIADDEEVEIVEHDSVPDEEDAKQRQQAIEQLTQQFQMAAQAAQMGDQRAQMDAQQLQAQIVQIQQQPPVMLHDIVCVRTHKRAGVKIENVPPEEFLISRQAKSVYDTPFVGHQVQRTVGELRAMGYEVPDNVASDDQIAALSAERIERISTDDEFGGYAAAYDSAAPSDSMRTLWVTECYLRVDRNGDGINEWIKVCKAGNELLEVEECDGPPFAVICPDPLPHRFFGTSVADMAMEIQKTKTAIMRTVLDNAYLNVNKRMFAVEGQVNLDDLLTSRPGGVVRVKAPGMAGPLDPSGSNSAEALQLLEYTEVVKEQRTGWSRNAQGMSSDALNTQTATGANIVANASSDRQEMIARNFAEGFKDLFNLILKLVCQHQDKEAQMAVAGQWVTVDPRQWRNKFELTCHVGIGSGDKTQQLQHLQLFGQFMLQAAQVGLVGPEETKAFGDELAKAMGLKSADKFIAKQPIQKQDGQDPAITVEQIKQQGEQAKIQAELQLEREKTALEQQQAQYTAQVEAEKKSIELQQAKEIEILKSQHQAELEMAKLQMQADIEWRKAQLDAETKLVVAQINSASKPSPEGTETTQEGPNTSDVLAMAMQGFQAALERLSMPKTVVRGADGRVIGVQ